MVKKIIPDVYINGESELYIDALHAVLNKAGYFKGPKFLLHGLTGLVFKFISHKRIISPSRYMYHLDIDSWKAVDRLGIYNEIYCGLKNNPTFPLYQKKTIERVKESIDKGIPVIFWEPFPTGFAVIHGYDELDQIFLYKSRSKNEDQIMLFENVGKVDANFWMFQIIGEKIDKDIRDIFLDSMECCVDEWETDFNLPVFAKNEYGCGRKAYDNIIHALEKDDFSEFGAISVLNHAILSKKHTYHFLKEASKEFKGMDNVIMHYKHVHDIFYKLRTIIPGYYSRGSTIDRSKLIDIISYLHEGKKEEELAVQSLKSFLRESLYNRHVDYYDVKKYT